ncbi:MAG: YbbR-like domain-containing protein [Myxococcales bacterium FL481]|nr:MAG: YbbR-like domain-containing protein [Myxococcales bacterium FL481]
MTDAPNPAGARQRWAVALWSKLIDDWQTKLAALTVTLIVFVVTRDDVRRTVSLPLRVTQDPSRVLMSKLPDRVDVVVHGHWTKVGRVGMAELGSVALDLRTVGAGPMSLESNAVRVPPGVLVERIEAPALELRFDPIIQRSLPVVAPLAGQVHADYEVASVHVEPGRADVRGGEQALSRVAELATERVSVAGATSRLDVVVALVRPDPRVQFVAASPPRVQVRVAVRPKIGERTWTVALDAVWRARAAELMPGDANQLERGAVDVTVRGGLPALNQLRGVADPLLAVLGEPVVGSSAPAVRVAFVWDPALPSELVADLEIVPRETIVAVRTPAPAVVP